MVLTFKAGLSGPLIIPWPGKSSGSDQSKDQLLLCTLTGEGEVGGGAITGKGEHIPPSHFFALLAWPLVIVAFFSKQSHMI